jgi:DNA (cytosine-5)-methyltransferase 1
MKQQTLIANPSACLNPWDTQQSRVFTEDGAAPTLAGADGGGGRNPAGLVFCSASSQSHAGITKELAGALTCQHEQPFICEPELARTLTARGDSSPCADRGQNVVAVSVHQNGNGDLSTSDTAKSLTTIGTASCRNAPLVAQVNAEAAGTSGNNRPYIVHPDVSGTLVASGAGLSRPAGMASEPDLCVAYALQGNMIGRQERSGPNGSGVSENLSFTLTATDTPAVASAIPIHDKATRFQGGGSTRGDDGCGNGLGVGDAGDPAPTLTSGDKHAAAIPINTQTATRSGALGEGTGFGVGKDTDPAFTLQQAHCHAVAAVDCRNYKEAGDVSGALQAKDKPEYSLNDPVRAGYIVRRLTPTECERLMGFPDGWTRFGHDGKKISDTRRYQMLGNSICVPCVAFILSGVAGALS